MVQRVRGKVEMSGSEPSRFFFSGRLRGPWNLSPSSSAVVGVVNAPALSKRLGQLCGPQPRHRPQRWAGGSCTVPSSQVRAERRSAARGVRGRAGAGVARARSASVTSASTRGVASDGAAAATSGQASAIAR